MTLLENAHGAVKEMFSYFERPVSEASFEEIPVLLKFLPKPDSEFVYVVAVQGKDVVIFLQPKPALAACLTGTGTTNNWVENKFEKYRALWHKAQSTSELVLQVHRALLGDVNDSVT